MDQKLAPIFRVYQSPKWFVVFVWLGLQGLPALHGLTCFDEGVITHLGGHIGLSGQV